MNCDLEHSAFIWEMAKVLKTKMTKLAAPEHELVTTAKRVFWEMALHCPWR